MSDLIAIRNHLNLIAERFDMSSHIDKDASHSPRLTVFPKGVEHLPLLILEFVEGNFLIKKHRNDELTKQTAGKPVSISWIESFFEKNAAFATDVIDRQAKNASELAQRMKDQMHEEDLQRVKLMGMSESELSKHLNRLSPTSDPKALILARNEWKRRFGSGVADRYSDIYSTTDGQ